MSLRKQFLLIIGIPSVGIILILLVGLFSFFSFRTTIGELSTIQQDRASILNADRDAYQAYLAQITAMNSTDAAELEEQSQASLENLDQTRERVDAPAARFTPEMEADYALFSNNYDEWRSESRRIVDIALQTADVRREIAGLYRDSEAVFSAMREQIDVLGVQIDGLLSGSLSSARRRTLEEALSLTLNGDRDAYQAYLALEKALGTQGTDQLQSFAADVDENMGQTFERVDRAAALLGSSAAELRTRFGELYAGWSEANSRILKLTQDIAGERSRQALLSQSSGENFAEMRNALDRLGNSMDERAAVSVTSMNASIGRAVIVYLLVAALSLGLSVLLTLILSSSMLRSIRISSDAATQLTTGDLSVAIDIKRSDEIGVLAESLRAMIRRLRGIVGDISQAADNISGGSEEIAKSAQQLSAGATEQAASSEQVSA